MFTESPQNPSAAPEASPGSGSVGSNPSASTLGFASSVASPSSRATAITTALKEADRLIAHALLMLQDGGLEDATGLSTEMVLCLDARRTGSEARFLTQAAQTLSHMPILTGLFCKGVLSWSQVRAMILPLARTSSAFRRQIDQVVGEHADRLAFADPKTLLAIIDEAIVAREPLDPEREERGCDHKLCGDPTSL